MWILKLIVGAFSILFCLIGILWLIPALIMWDHKPVDEFYRGIWDTNDKFFEK